MKDMVDQKGTTQYAGLLGLVALCGTTLIGSSAALAQSKPLGGHVTPDRYVVKGKLINIQGNNYWIRKSTGEDVKVQITNDTNMVCEISRDMPSKSITTGRMGLTRKAESKGFRIGDCPPDPGQYVKAETTDIGTVSFLRSYQPETIMSQTERLGLPQQYSVHPVVRGELEQKSVDRYTVQTEDGKQIGNLKKVIIDTQVGDIVYGVVALDQEALRAQGMELARGSLMAAPWEGFAVPKEDGKHITLQATFKQLGNFPAFSEDISAYDVRAYWELHDPNMKNPVSPTRQGVDRLARLELEKERAQYEAARDRYLDTQVKFEDDQRAMERARERWEQALLEYRTDEDKTIQQELQKQIFR